jgi:Bacteriophage holin of superfamily 6 (Holin_LLH)
MSPEIMHALTNALVAVLTVTIPVVGTFAANWLKTHTSQQQLESLQTIGGMSVKAVEQIYGDLSGDNRAAGDAKLIAAKQRAQDMAARFGVKLTDDQARTIIEQAVHEMNQSDSPPNQGNDSSSSGSQPITPVSPSTARFG